MDDSLKDIVYGSVAGAAGKIIEYPFDTVKVRLQSQREGGTQFKGPVDCLRKSLKSEGLLGLYRGVASPIVGAAAETASLFVTYNLAQKYVHDGTMVGVLACGSISGAFTSFILTPVELIKCQMQVQTSLGTSRMGMSKLISQIYRQYGLSGFWKGQLGTLLRETGGSAAWFGAYEYTGRFLFHHKESERTAIESMLAGAAAGISYNVSLFPIDTIKSRIQTDPACTSLLRTGQLIVQQGGISALYRGCGVTICRSAPSSGIIFLTYETLKHLY